ncbi:MAG TPA: N-acetylmuramoyl-L-alanine amidase [Rhodanobacteraceae bacterium]
MGEVVIHDWPLPYTSQLAERDFAGVDLVVIHCTELPDLATARSYGERELYDDGTGNSGHYYIDRSGATYNFVPDHRIAHHTRGFNPRSIGIELINIGRFPDWFDSRHQAMDEPYTATQIASLKGLLAHLVRIIPSLALIAGHEDLDTERVPASDNAELRVARKRDPGPLFPWDDVLAACRLQRLRATV